MVTIYFIWIIRVRIQLQRKRYPIQIQKIPNIQPDWTQNPDLVHHCTVLLALSELALLLQQLLLKSST